MERLIFIQLVILLFSAILITADFYFLSKFRKFIFQRGYPPVITSAGKIISYIMILVLAGLLVSKMFLPDNVALQNYLFMSVSIWYLPKLPVSVFLLAADLIKSAGKIIAVKSEKHQETQNSNISLDAGRRKFVRNISWGLATVPFFAAGKGVALTAYDFEIREVFVPIKNLHESFRDIKLVQISDLHFGSFYSSGPLKKVSEAISKLDTDLLLVTGDFVNSSPLELKNGLDEIASTRTKHGIYACLGNHDHYMSAENHEVLVKEIKNSGIGLMINESKIFNFNGASFNLAAVDNVGHGQKFGDFEKAMKGTDSSVPTIMLCHDPSNWDKNIRNKYKVDLTLAGHTHGGQIGFEKFGLNVSLVSMMYKQWAGLYTEGGCHLYVNRGIGMSGPPIRLGIKPEITLIRFTPEKGIS